MQKIEKENRLYHTLCIWLFVVKRTETGRFYHGRIFGLQM